MGAIHGHFPLRPNYLDYNIESEFIINRQSAVEQFVQFVVKIQQRVCPFVWAHPLCVPSPLGWVRERLFYCAAMMSRMATKSAMSTLPSPFRSAAASKPLAAMMSRTETASAMSTLPSPFRSPSTPKPQRAA